MIPTSNEITHFLELYGTLHLSNSAIRLGVTQPSLTQSLQKLEGKVGAALFIRTKRGLIPTTAGKHFYGRAKTLVEYWEGLSSDINALGEELRGKFRVGCHPAVGAYVLPPLLKKLNESAPEIELQLIHDYSRKITERLVAYEIDMAFVINPVRHPDLVLTKIGEDRVTFWQKRGKNSLPKRLIADPTTGEALLGKAYAKKFEGWTILQSTSLELIRTLTLDGQGVGILPERVARAESSTLVPFDPSLPALKDEIFLVYRKSVMSSKAGQLLLKHARAEL